MDPFSVLAIGVALLGAGAATGIHRVPEGHVSVYYRGGALLKNTDGPGFHFSYPLITHAEYVQTTVQTDNVMSIPCGTAGGTIITFDRIEVVNQLDAAAVYDTVKNYTTKYDKTWIYDKIHHEVNQICSRSTLEEVYISKFDTLDEILRDALQKDIDQYAPGIKILAIRVTKPRIPEHIKKHYEQIESERTRLQVAIETQRLVEKEAETARLGALIQARQKAEVEAVELARRLKQKENERAIQLMEKENDQTMADIANQMHTNKAKADADAAYYRVTREAEANKLLHTPELLQLESIRALGNNTKVYWGEKLPNVAAMGQIG